jgi:DNA-binding MarR family transcriptional regulator
VTPGDHVRQLSRREKILDFLHANAGATPREIARAVRSGAGQVSIDLSELEAMGRIHKAPCPGCKRPRWEIGR